MLFRIKSKSGPHYVGKQKFVVGDILESSQELDKKWPTKFERLMDIPQVLKEAKKAPAPAKEPEPEPTPAQEPKKAQDLGKDVTEEFKVAEQKGLMVFRKVAKFSVTDQTDPETVLYSTNSRRKVEDYLDQY